jgi:hypothetical protein
MARQLGRIETAEAGLDKLATQLREELLPYDTQHLPC